MSVSSPADEPPWRHKVVKTLYNWSVYTPLFRESQHLLHRLPTRRIKIRQPLPQQSATPLSLPFQSKRGIIANEKALEKQGLFSFFRNKNHNKTNCSEPLFSVFFATPTRISIAAYCFSVTDKTRTLPASGTKVFSRFLCFSAVSSPLHIHEQTDSYDIIITFPRLLFSVIPNTVRP